MQIQKQHLVIDLAMFQLVVIMMAFKDYRMLAILSQVTAFVIITGYYFLLKRTRIDMRVFQYTLYKLIFVAWCAFSEIWAVKPSVVSERVITMVLRMMMGIAIVIYVSSEEKRDSFLRYCVAAGVILCIRLFLTVPFEAWGSERVGNYLQHDVSNMYGNTGITYVLGVIAVYLIVFEHLMNIRLRYFLILLFSIVSFFSGSKKMVVILVLAFMVYLFYKSKNLPHLIRNIIFFVAASTIGLYLIFKIDALYNILGQRILKFLNYFFEDTQSSSDMSTINRARYMQLALQYFYQHPILGIGLDSFRYVNPNDCWAENNYVELLADVGAIGAISYYLLHFRAIMKLIGNKLLRDKRMQCMIILCALLFIDYTMVSYENSSLQFHLAFWFALVG